MLAFLTDSKICRVISDDIKRIVMKERKPEVLKCLDLIGRGMEKKA